jgi:hypothetical protein
MERGRLNRVADKQARLEKEQLTYTIVALLSAAVPLTTVTCIQVGWGVVLSTLLDVLSSAEGQQITATAATDGSDHQHTVSEALATVTTLAVG